MAARRLITPDALVDALLWSGDEYELAEELWVDVDTVRTRLADLTVAERTTSTSGCGRETGECLMIKGLERDLLAGETALADVVVGYHDRSAVVVATSQRVLLKLGKNPATGYEYEEVDDYFVASEKRLWRIHLMSRSETHALTTRDLAGIRAVVAEIAKRFHEADVRDGVRLRFAGMRVHSDRIETTHGSAPLRGLRAEVVAGGQIARARSAGAILAFGVLGLAATKQIDERSLYLSLVGEGLGFAQELHPDRAGEARQFAAELNALASSSASAITPPEVGSGQGAAAGIVDQIRGRAELHAAGILTDEEFTVKKTDLLSRL